MYFSRRKPGDCPEYQVEAFLENPVTCYNNDENFDNRIYIATFFVVSFDRFNTCSITGGKVLGTYDCYLGLDYSINLKSVNLKEGEMYYVVGE